MTTGATLAVLMPPVAVYLVIEQLWRRLTVVRSRMLAAAVAPGLGLGLASCVYFFLLLLTHSAAAATRWDFACWSLVDVVLLWSAVRRTKSGPQRVAETHVTRIDWKPALALTAAGCLMLLAVAETAFWLRWTADPHGEWDAWAIWNLRARAILRGVPDWNALLSPAIGWSNPDYPLLLPLTVARLWAYTGRESLLVPAVVATMFFLSSVATLVVSVGRLRGWSAGFLSGMALLMARTYVFQGSCQCADVPIGFFILVAICLLSVSRLDEVSGPILVVAGAAAGFAAWTKNEGILLLILVAVAVSVMVPRLRAFTSVGAGAAIPVLALAVFKLGLAPSNYLFGLQGSGDLTAKLLDGSRWMLISERLVDLVPAWGHVSGGAVLSLGIVVALTAHTDRPAIGRATFALLVTTALMFGYVLVYVVTPLPLAWQIATSFERLFTQLWPALVWAAFQLSGSSRPLQRSRTG